MWNPAYHLSFIIICLHNPAYHLSFIIICLHSPIKLLIYLCTCMFDNLVGNQDKDYMLTEKDWAVLESGSPYEKSKLLAEQSAWEFVQKMPGKTYYSYHSFVSFSIFMKYFIT